MTNSNAEDLPEAGHKIGLVNNHGMAQIVKDLSEAEQEIKDELEGKTDDSSGNDLKEEAVITFQVVKGDMFSKVLEPMIRIFKNSVIFGSVALNKMITDYVELLLNPVERIIVIRPCQESHSNAIAWKSNKYGASSLCKIIYQTMGWDLEYSYKVLCQSIRRNSMTILTFDLDNYIGQSSRKKDEVIVPVKDKQDSREETRSFFYSPDEDEPQEIKEIEEKPEKRWVETTINRICALENICWPIRR